MIAGAWFAFASAIFAVLALGCSFFIGHRIPIVVMIDDPLCWHVHVARIACMVARDVFGLFACAALLWHLFTRM